MTKYIDLELPVLIDLLVKHTDEYTRLLPYSMYYVEEFAQCKRTLSEIQQATKEKIEQNGLLLNNIFIDASLPDMENK